MNHRQSTKLIDGRQLFLLLFLGRMFSMMTYSPGKEAVHGSAVLASQPPALLAGLILFLFIFGVMCRCGQSDLLNAVYQKNAFIGQVCAAAALLVCLLQTAKTITVQTDFLTGTIYHQPNRMGLLLALWGGILYVSWLGLEAFSRLSMGVFAVFVLMTTVLVIQVFPYIDLLNLHDPLEEGGGPILKGTALSLSRCGEIAAAVLLCPAVRGKALRHTALSALLWTIFTALVSFLVLTVLGNFAALRSFPVYTLALAAGENSTLGRLDAFLLLVWIFLAVIRGGMYQWLAAQCLSRLCGKGKAFCLPLSSAGTLLIAVSSNLWGQMWESPLLWGSSTLTVALILPITAAFCTKKGGRQA